MEKEPNTRVELINSVLTGFLHSCGTAKRLNAQPTGHMGTKVMVGSHFTMSFQELQPNRNAALRRQGCYFIDQLHLHAESKPHRGSLPFDGWVVEDGK